MHHKRTFKEIPHMHIGAYWTRNAYNGAEEPQIRLLFKDQYGDLRWAVFGQEHSEEFDDYRILSDRIEFTPNNGESLPGHPRPIGEVVETIVARARK